MLCGHEIYYNYIDSDNVYQLPVEPHKGTQVAFRSIDILKFDENEPNFFELLLGSDEGHIFYGVVEVKEDGRLEVVTPLKVVVQTPDFSSILEIKMTKIKDVYLVLAVSATKLYQLIGQESLESTL